MHYDDKVAFVDSDITFGDIKINDFDVIDQKLLPVMIKNMPNKERMFELWWRDRTIPVGRREYYNLIRLLFQISFRERPLMTNAIFIVSLLSYGQTLEDKYWFNPEQEMNVPCFRLSGGGMDDILLEPKQFEEIDFFKNKFDLSLSRFFINSWESGAKINSFNNPSLNTNGCIQKYWDVIDSQFYLMKYLYNVNELNFNEILVNDWLTKNYPDLSNKLYIFKKNLSDFNLTTDLEKTFSLIASKCFVDENTEFIPASDIALATGIMANDVYDMYYEGCNLLGIKDAEYPIVVSNELEDFFGIREERSFDNFGFIRDAKSRVFIKPSPLFGNSYYKYILDR